VILLLGRFLRIYTEREHLVQTILDPQLARIKADYSGAERHKRISNLYRRYGYKSHFILENYYVGLHANTNSALFDELYPPRNPDMIRFDFLQTLLRGIFQGECLLETCCYYGINTESLRTSF
jgi:hypothetical protein